LQNFANAVCVIPRRRLSDVCCLRQHVYATDPVLSATDFGAADRSTFEADIAKTRPVATRLPESAFDVTCSGSVSYGT